MNTKTSLNINLSDIENFSNEELIQLRKDLDDYSNRAFKQALINRDNKKEENKKHLINLLINDQEVIKLVNDLDKLTNYTVKMPMLNLLNCIDFNSLLWGSNITFLSSINIYDLFTDNDLKNDLLKIKSNIYDLLIKYSKEIYDASIIESEFFNLMLKIHSKVLYVDANEKKK